MHIGTRGDVLVCQTRDISREGCFLDTVEYLDQGTELSLSLLDADTGDVVEASGIVQRTLAPRPDGSGLGVGVYFPEPSEQWQAMVQRHEKEHTQPGIGSGRSVRLRIVVAGNEKQRRGALALYVTSGWDVRFASDVDGVREALSGVKVDAVIAEHDLDDEHWADILRAAMQVQPAARRIVRCKLHGKTAPDAGSARDLVHRVVDLDAGLDALLDALTADYGEASPAPDGR